jgi:hypothetical protein
MITQNQHGKFLLASLLTAQESGTNTRHKIQYSGTSCTSEKPT